MKTGDRVVCIDDSGGHYTNLKKGREYIIYDVKKKQCGCNGVLIDVGLSSSVEPCLCTCGSCRKYYYDTLVHYVGEQRFRKVEEKVSYVKLEIEVEEPCLN